MHVLRGAKRGGPYALYGDGGKGVLVEVDLYDKNTHLSDIGKDRAMAEADVDTVTKKRRSVRQPSVTPVAVRRAGIAGQRAMREASEAGLLDSESESFSFRVPKALVAAAKRESGIESNSLLGRVALAMLAQADPFAEFFKRTEGVLGPDHDLEY